MTKLNGKKLVDTIHLTFARDDFSVVRGFAKPCTDENIAYAHHILENPGEQIFHSVETVFGIEYDFVATLKPRENV